jgi:hypothetical protein
MMHAADEWRPRSLRPVLQGSSAVAGLQLQLVPCRSSVRAPRPEGTSRSPRAVETFFASSAEDPSRFSHADVSDRAQSRRYPHTGRSVSTLQAAAAAS